MKITPLEIRQKTFEKSLRGYNKEEVAAYLNSLSLVWDRMLDENEQLKAQLSEAKEEVKKLKEVETTLFKTLRTAEETGASMVEQAQKTAHLSVQEGQMKANQILADAQEKAKRLLQNAESNAAEVITGMEEEVRRMDEIFRQLKHHSQDFVGDFKNTVGSLLGKMDALELRTEEMDSSGILQEVKAIARAFKEREKLSLEPMADTPSPKLEEEVAPAKPAPEKIVHVLEQEDYPMDATEEDASFESGEEGQGDDTLAEEKTEGKKKEGDTSKSFFDEL